VTRRPHWSGELLVLVGLLVVYDRVAGLAKVRADEAYAHGRDLLELSPAGLEKAANLWLAGVGWLYDPFAYYYDLAHIDVTLVVFLLCWFLRPGVYRQARTSLVVINLIALGIVLLYPVAPPRLLPSADFVDIVALSGTWGSGGAVADRANEFGAMPSLHLAWAVWVALTVWTMTESRWWRGLGWVHVALTGAVTVYTGNHYLLDLLAGALLAAAAWAGTAQVRQRWGRTATSQVAASTS